MPQSFSLARRLEAVTLLGLAAIFRQLPRRTRVAVGQALGRWAAGVDRHHLHLASRNIAAALGTDPEDSRRLARRTFAYFGRVFAECLSMPAYRGEALEQAVELVGLEHLAQAHAEGRGVIVVSGHIGNWELGALRQGQAGFPMDYIARPLDNPWLDRQFIRWRESGGGKIHSKHGALRSAVQTLRAGRILAYMVDQNATFPPRIFVPYFGRLAATSPAMGSLASRLGSAVVPAVACPNPDGSYVFRFFPALPLPSGTAEEQTYELTAAATRLLESWVRERPETWLWLHDRWKTRPEPHEVPKNGVACDLPRP